MAPARRVRLWRQVFRVPQLAGVGRLHPAVIAETAHPGLAVRRPRPLATPRLHLAAIPPLRVSVVARPRQHHRLAWVVPLVSAVRPPPGWAVPPGSAVRLRPGWGGLPRDLGAAVPRVQVLLVQAAPVVVDWAAATIKEGLGKRSWSIWAII